MSRRSKVLLLGASLGLAAYGCAFLIDFVYLLYRMKHHHDSLEELIAQAFATGRSFSPFLLTGLILLIAFAISAILDARKKAN